MLGHSVSIAIPLGKKSGASESLGPVAFLFNGYTPVSWRGTTNTDGQRIGVSFTQDDGTILRLAVDCESARSTAETILEFLDAYAARINSQSERSSGSSVVDGAAQDATTSAPLNISSSADSGVK